MTIWYILWPFWYVLSVSVCCTKKNLATLIEILAPARDGPENKHSVIGVGLDATNRQSSAKVVADD
jgi:hypothetical protein